MRLTKNLGIILVVILFFNIGISSFSSVVAYTEEGITEEIIEEEIIEEEIIEEEITEEEIIEEEITEEEIIEEEITEEEIIEEEITEKEKIEGKKVIEELPINFKKKNDKSVDFLKSILNPKLFSVFKNDNLKNKTNKKINMLYNWDYEEINGEIILYNYLGLETEIVIPGEVEGKQVNLAGIKKKLFSSYLTSLVFQEVNGKKVKLVTTSLNNAFENAYRNLEIIDVSGLDVSNVTTMESTFRRLPKLVSLKGLETWDTSQVTNMRTLFENVGVEEFDLSMWNVSNVTEFNGMFSKSANLKNVNISGWDMSKATSVNQMFSESVSGTINASNVKFITVTGLFYYTKAQDIDVTKADTSKVKSMRSMFNGATNLKILKGLETWDTQNLIDTYGMFWTTGLESLDLSHLNMSKVTNMYRMLGNNPSLKELNISNWDISSVDNRTEYLVKNPNLLSINASHMKVGENGRELFSKLSVKYINVTNMDTSNTSNFSGVFLESKEVEQIDGLETLNTSNVTDISYMFKYTWALKEVNIGNWDVSNVIGMRSVFYQASSLEKIEMANWNTKKVTHSYQMFRETHVKELDLSGWNTNNIEDMSLMFAYSDFIKLDLSGWDSSKATSWKNMFITSGKKRKLLVIATDEKLKAYDYIKDNRIPAGPTADAGKGKFSDGTSIHSVFNRFVISDPLEATISSEVYDNLLKDLPVKERFIFQGWVTDSQEDSNIQKIGLENKSATISILDKLDETYYAKWEVITKTVSFITNGGNEIEPIIVEINLPIDKNKINTPLNKGFMFDGWYQDETLTKVWDFKTKVNEDMTLYAKWKIKYFNVSFATNGGSSIDMQQVQEGQIIKPTATPVKKGYTFMGWYSDKEVTQMWSPDTEVLKDITLYAKWERTKYTINFESNGGSRTPNQIIIEGEKVKRNRDPEKLGYTFVGWYVDKELNQEWDFETTIFKNTTLYAKWEIREFIVSFESTGDSIIPEQKIIAFELSEQPEDPVRAGYVFLGWFNESGNKWNFNTEIIGNTIIYGKWIVATFEVKFDSNGGTKVESQFIENKKMINTPKNPIKVGYVFDGWYFDKALMLPWNFDTEITGELTLYAKWTVATFLVKFDTAGGSAVEEQIIDYEQFAVEPPIPNKSGYIFDGWYSNRGLTEKWDFDSKITKNTTIYAKWIAITYLITFDSGEGSFVPSQVVREGIEIAEPKKPTLKGGYIFDGWYADENRLVLWNFDTLVFQNTTLYAKYKKKITNKPNNSPGDVTGNFNNNGLGEVGLGEVGSGEDGSGEDGSGEDGSGEDGSGEVGSGEDGSGEDGSGEDGLGEDGSGEDGSLPSTGERYSRIMMIFGGLILFSSFIIMRLSRYRKK